MASIDKFCRLRFRHPHSKRIKEFAIGATQMTANMKKEFIARVERLITSLAVGQEPDAETAKWLRGLPPTLLQKMSEVGLIGAGHSIPTALETFWNAFIASREERHMAKATMAHYKMAKERMVQHFGPNKDIRSLTVGDVLDFAGRMKWKGKRPSKTGELAGNTVRKRCATARAAFQWAVDHELLTKNVFADKKVPKRVGAASAERRYHLTHQDALKVLEHIDRIDMRAWFVLCRWGGLRACEPLALRWEMVDWDKNRLTIPCEKTAHQGKPTRTMPLFPQMRKALMELFEQAPEREPHLFPKAKQVTTQALTKHVKRAATEAGLLHWPRTLQNLRASCATDLADEFPSHVCAEFLGHTEEVADHNYRRANERHYERAMEWEHGKARTETAPAAQSGSVGILAPSPTFAP